ncbi:MAG: acetolactate synthase [Xanthomonadaceae bacterium]|jgi:acetolactate synthase II small subunit|nr:acetolactate synthase [Xanthomonadaceae bacterium]
MRYQLDMTVKAAEGAVIRMAGMVERRGFTLRGIQGEVQPDSGIWQLRLVVESPRAPEALKHQLEKLYDCLSIRIVPIAATAEAAA